MPAEVHDDDYDELSRVRLRFSTGLLSSMIRGLRKRDKRTYLSLFGSTESSKTPAPCAEGIRVCYPPVKNLLGSIKVLLDLLDPREHLRLMT